MTKILLVDDQPTLVALMSEFLTSEGYDVTTHTDGLTALQQMIALRSNRAMAAHGKGGVYR